MKVVGLVRIVCAKPEGMPDNQFHRMTEELSVVMKDAVGQTAKELVGDGLDKYITMEVGNFELVVEGLFDNAILDHGSDLLLSGDMLPRYLDTITMRRLDMQVMPSPEQLEENESWWKVRTEIMDQYLEALKGHLKPVNVPAGGG